MTAVQTTCPYCGVGCGLKISRTSRGIAVAADDTHPANLGRICSKGSALGETVDLDGRLLQPEIAGRRASWDQALGLVAARFRAAIDTHGPDSVAFYVSGQLLTEDYYVANKLMKGYIGSANIDTNSRLCMASSVAGYRRAFGADLVPNSYRDIELADLLVLVGANMAWCHPVLFQRARQTKEMRPELKIVVIDPRRTSSCDIADLHLPIRPGTDVALFAGLLDFLRREDALDWEFIDEHTEGFGKAARAARDSMPSIPQVARACGLADGDVAQFFRLFARTPNTVSLFSQGVNQSTSGSDKVNSIVNLHLATGRIGKPGAGPFSLTGQPNAMGGREVGGLANQLAAHMDFAPDHCDRVQRFWRSPRIASTEGLKAVDLFRAAGDGRIKALWIMSTNPVVSMPDADSVKRALDNCEFVAVTDCMRSTDTTACADVILPAAAWGEKSGTVTNSERTISRQRAFLKAPGEARPDWWIVAEVAKRLGFGEHFDYSGPAAIFREHAALSAFENGGSRDFDIGALATLSDAAYEALAPVRWPLASGRKAVEPLSDRRFYTPSGRARFVATLPTEPAAQRDVEHPFVMLTGRIRDQWHTMTRTGKSPRLAQTRAEPFVQINTRDAIGLKLANNSIARIVSAKASLLARVEWSDEIRSGELFVPMHWTSQMGSAGRVGPLIASAVDPVSGQPELKATPVRVEPVQFDWYGFLLSRRRLGLDPSLYVVCSRGQGYWRYELAGADAPDRPDQPDWPEWARGLLGAGGDWVEFSDPKAGGYRGAQLVAGRLSACLFIAPKTRLPDRAWLGGLFANDRLSDRERLSLLAGRPDDGMATGPVICACHGVGRDALIRAITSQGVATVKEIGSLLKAGTNCGSCIPELNGLLAEHRPEPEGEAAEAPARQCVQ
jgi:assimilatory nitrate reductase catalytic subunit